MLFRGAFIVQFIIPRLLTRSSGIIDTTWIARAQRTLSPVPVSSANLYQGIRHVYIPRRPAGSTPNPAVRSTAPNRPSNSRPGQSRTPPKLEDLSRKPRDEEIRHRKVRLVDPDTGSLGPLTDLRLVIEYVRNRPVLAAPGGDGEDQASPPTEGKREKWWKRKWCVELVSEVPDPIVRVVNINDEYRKAKEAQKKKKEGVIKEKEVQMTWSVAQGDWEHKLKKTKEALEEGERVVIGFTRKKGQPWPKPEEMQAKMQETMEQLSDIAEEWKQRVTLPNATGFIYIQSKL